MAKFDEVFCERIIWRPILELAQPHLLLLGMHIKSNIQSFNILMLIEFDRRMKGEMATGEKRGKRFFHRISYNL